VTRIIAGFAGSIPLVVPKTGTRPTSDRVREAIFSALEARDAIDNARVLDLYAGSGALGLEAVSRGARSLVLVDHGKAAVNACRANVAKLLSAGSASITVSESKVKDFLWGGSAEWDLVFIDPPYELGSDELVQNLEDLLPRLSEHAVVVVERSARDAEPAWPAGLVRDKRKDYGDTTVWWISPQHRPSQ
jgi:16S rRNA (guanine966-N2)-methyltransferase